MKFFQDFLGFNSHVDFYRLSQISCLKVQKGGLLKRHFSFLVLALALIVHSSSSFAKKHGNDNFNDQRSSANQFLNQTEQQNRNSSSYKKQQGKQTKGRNQLPTQQAAQDDRDLVRAVQDKRNVHFVEAGDLEVVKLLPDDTQGLPHQRWYVRLSNGAQVFCVYNLDMGGKIPLKVGDRIAIGGEFKMTNVGPLMHWLHDDPRDRRPDGYVDFNGQRYGIH